MSKLISPIKPDLLGLEQVAEILGISDGALYRLRKKEGFPKGRYAYNKKRMHMPRVVFKKEEIMEWKALNSIKQN